MGDIPSYAITDDFDDDFGARDWHGSNAFIRKGEPIFCTSFISSRDGHMGSTWSYLDIAALGRQEEARALGLNGRAAGSWSDWQGTLSLETVGTPRKSGGRCRIHEPWGVW